MRPMNSRNRIRDFVFKLTGLCTVGLLVIIAGELFAGYYYKHLADSVIRTKKITSDLKTDWTLLRKGKSPLNRVQPNFQGIFFGAWTMTNSDGFRGKGYTQEKSEGVFRIVVLGESYTFGWGVDQDKIFTILLEEMLNQRKGSLRYEVYNLAMQGTNFMEQVMILEEIGLLYKPDLIIQTYILSDAKMSPWNLGFEACGVLLPKSHILMNGITKRSKLFRLMREQLSDRAIQVKYKGYKFYALYRENDPHFQCVKKTFIQLEQLVKENNIPLLFIIMPKPDLVTGELLTESSYPYGDLHQKIAQIAKSHDFHSVDYLPYFYEQNREELVIHPLDGRPSAKYHKMVARFLYKTLHQKQMIPSADSQL